MSASSPVRPNAAIDPTTERLAVDDVRVSMVRVIAAWGFGAAFFNLTMGAVYTTFARRIGADERVIGLLFAALPLMSFLQVISARLLEKTGKRKQQMLVAGLIGRTLWIVGPAAPLLALRYPDLLGRDQVLQLVIVCVLLSSVFQAFTGPAFFAWMSDLVPGRVRPSFFAQRMRVGTSVAMVTALASGFIADKFPTLPVYCVLLMIAGVCGVLDIALFFGVKEPPMSEVPKDEDGNLPSMWASFANAWREPQVRTFLTFVSLVMIGYGLQGAFALLFAREYLGLNNTTTGLVMNIAPLLGITMTSRFWGGIIKRYGNRPVMRLNSVGLALVPIAFITARSENWLSLAVVMFFSGAIAAGIDLTNVNLLTGIAPQLPRPTLTALFSIIAGTSMAAASLLGGQLTNALKWVGDMDFELFGLPMVNYHMLFGLSLLVRLVNATFVAPRLQEPAASSTLEAVKEVVPEIIENIATRLSQPVAARSEAEKASRKRRKNLRKKRRRK